MKKPLIRRGMALLIVLMLMLSSACRKQSTTSSSSDSSGSSTGKYSPAITVTSVLSMDSTVKFQPGQSYDNNVWTQLFEDQLGIKFKYLWEVPSTQYNDKLTLSIASNDLPDIIPIYRNTDLKQLVDNGVIQDLTKAEKSASKQLKDVLLSDNGITRNSAVYNGKLYAMSEPSLNPNNMPVLWLRSDWMSKLGLSDPKSMNDVFNIMDAFVNKDPDGNGKKDTVGMLLDKTLANLTGFFAGYHAYPLFWTTGSDGKATYGSISNETKQALAKLQELYKSGVIDSEFSVKDSTAEQKFVDTGKCGLIFDVPGIPSYVLKNSHTNDPKCDWKPYAIPSIDSKTAKVMEPFGVSAYFAVNKNCKNPEVLYKASSLWCEKWYNGSAEDTTKYIRNGDYIAISKETFLGNGIESSNASLDQLALVQKALKAKSSDGLTASPLSYYTQITSYLNGDQTYWFRYKQFGDGGGMSVLKYYVDNEKDVILHPSYTGAPTPTMQTKQSTLKQMETETFTKIIMGQSQISEFDKFVSDWKSLGGNDILKEINASLSTNSSKK